MDSGTMGQVIAAYLFQAPDHVREVAAMPIVGGMETGVVRITDVDGVRHLLMVMPDLPPPSVPGFIAGVCKDHGVLGCCDLFERTSPPEECANHSHARMPLPHGLVVTVCLTDNALLNFTEACLELIKGKVIGESSIPGSDGA